LKFKKKKKKKKGTGRDQEEIEEAFLIQPDFFIKKFENY
jgi:hypothetical protein